MMERGFAMVRFLVMDSNSEPMLLRLTFYAFAHNFLDMDEIPSRFEALKQVRAAFSSDQAMADALGVAQTTVWRWLNQSRQLPAEKVLLAEEITQVSRHYLRPDIYPVETPAALPAWRGVDQGTDRVSFNRNAGLKAAAQGRAA